MNVKVSLQAGDKDPIQDIVRIDDYKLEELTEDELEAAIEVYVRNWANSLIRIEWETEDENEAGA